jgi:hypothetical protein
MRNLYLKINSDILIPALGTDVFYNVTVLCTEFYLGVLTIFASLQVRK